MLELKNYQTLSLQALSDYFSGVRRLGDAESAFLLATKRHFGRSIPWRDAVELPGLPYVCLRIPTGGGKTLVAAHAAGIAARELVETDRPVVLWLVPSNPIREQTLAALRNGAHPYRRALEERLGPCEVLDVAEALSASRSRYASGAVAIVATMQAFRVGDTEGRKAYEPNGSLMDHLTGLPTAVLADLDRMEDGSAVPSLANVLRLYRPIVLVDEAHNARTDLSFETLARFRPSCVVEFTATPAHAGHPSNVLHTVSAAELNVEHMIKLPIRLETRPDWKALLSDAVSQLGVLDEAARRERIATGEYLRPIMLIQAEANRRADPVTVDVVRQTLLEDHRIPEEQIARATGALNELDGANVLSPTSPVRFVITVQQLREGWDCPWAYVLCSLAANRSATAVEQLLGRVMRLPGARKKSEPGLNRAYAFAVSASFAEAANSLADALVQNGFEREEAARLIDRVTPSYVPGELPLFDGWDPPAGAESAEVSVTVAAPPDLAALPPELAARLTLDPERRQLGVRGELSEEERDALAEALPGEEGKRTAEALYLLAKRATARIRETAAPLSVPLLAIRQGELWEPFDETHFLEAEWDLARCDPSLTPAEWSPEMVGAQLGEVTITDAGRAEYFLTELHQQLALVAPDAGTWTIGALAHWLDRAIPHPDISPDATGTFLVNALRYLTEERGIPLAELVRDKYRLRHGIEAKIERHRRAAYGSEYQALLALDSPTPVGVSPDVRFTFEPDAYPYRFIYQGPRRWRKHALPVVGDLEPQGEEFQCACLLDEGIPEVVRWVRNVPRQPAFWMQTSTDKFYPDFVAELADGRVLVIEFKGADRWSDDDSREKRALGALWEARSGGSCLFIMPRGPDWEAIRAKVAWH
jgi:type III restriction enzyme